MGVALDHLRPLVTNCQSQPAILKGFIRVSRISGPILPNLNGMQWYRDRLPQVRNGGLEREGDAFRGASRHHGVEVFLILKIYRDAFLRIDPSANHRGFVFFLHRI